MLRAAKEALNHIDIYHLQKHYRLEQGYTYELNLYGDGREPPAKSSSPAPASSLANKRGPLSTRDDSRGKSMYEVLSERRVLGDRPTHRRCEDRGGARLLRLGHRRSPHHAGDDQLDVSVCRRWQGVVGSQHPLPRDMVMYSVLAQHTTNLHFMPTIYIVPMRDPFTLAKSISTAAYFSDNRVILGLGVGWMAEEFALTGQSWTNRGKRTDEMLEVMAKLMAGGMVEYHGTYYDFPPMQMAPATTKPVPVWVGGHTDAALRRAARHDGWIGVNYDFDDIVPLHRQSSPKSASGRALITSRSRSS